jgi:hypothetical protein
MNDTFQILARFLEHFGDEVEGRELAEPADDVKIKLRQLAGGGLPEPEQAELFNQLNRNPQWIAWLATQVKSRRSTKAPGSGH